MPRYAQLRMMRTPGCCAQDSLLTEDRPTQREIFTLLQLVQNIRSQQQRARTGSERCWILRHDLTQRVLEFGAAPRPAQTKLHHQVRSGKSECEAIIYRTIEAV